VYPSLRSAQINVTVILDISGSILDEDMQEFLAEIDAIKAQMRARIVLHACDVVLSEEGPWLYEPWEEVKLPCQFAAGGGTNFIPAFQWVGEQDTPPDLLVYFTDAEGEFPSLEPSFPVLWLVKGKAAVPWGIRIQLN
jgi:predicted metal-dependent peptidase